MDCNVIVNQPSPTNSEDIPLNVINSGTSNRNADSNESSEKFEDGRHWMETPMELINKFPKDLINLAAIDEIIIDLNKHDVFEILNKKRENIFMCFDISEEALCIPTENIYSIADKHRNEIMRFKKPSNFCLGCTCFLPLCPDEMEVNLLSNGDFKRIGVVNLTGYYLPSFLIKNENNEKLYDIEGPACQCVCSKYKFQVYKRNTNEKVAVISTKNLFCERTCGSNPNQFRIVFKQNFDDIHHKVLILAAGFYINNNFFDTTQFFPPCLL